MNGNKQRTLELLWRIFMICYLPKYLSPMEKLTDELTILSKNLSKFACSSIEQQLLTIDIIPLQQQQINFTPIVHFLIKWVQLICAHYKFWIYDLQESFSDGRAFLYIISYYLPSLCDYTHDIKHLTTLATCQTRDEHIQFNLELNQQQLNNIYERNVKINFRLLEEYIKQIGTFSYDFIKYEYYAKDIPDERCTIMILAMLAHDLLFTNHHHHHHNDEINFRHQSIFEELSEKYSNNKEKKIINQEEIEIIRDDSIISSEISILIDTPPIEEILTHKFSISSTTIIYSSKETHFIQSEEQSILDTMNYDILDRLELLSDLDDDDEDDDNDDSFNSARSSSTTARIDHRRTTMSTISLDDFIELERTIENEENKTNNTSLVLIDETISSDIDSNELNHKFDETCFADPVNKKLIKEILTLFLSHQQQQIVHKREIHAAEIIQAYWRGYQVRFKNQHNNHPIISILKKIRLNNSNALLLRESMIKIIRDFSKISTNSVHIYLQFLYDIEPIINCSIQIRYLIIEQDLLRLFFILIKCCNRSEPSRNLFKKILNILQLFTIKHNLCMKLIEKFEQIKVFIMLLLKYYQNNGSELFKQICFLLQNIVKNEKAREILRLNKSFIEAIEYIYKRLFNENRNYRQFIRSTPKKFIILNSTSKMICPSDENLFSIKQFMKVFYCL